MSHAPAFRKKSFSEPNPKHGREFFHAAKGDQSGQSLSQNSHPKTEQSSEAPHAYPIIVHSHLHWDWVWQRPQQFLSRLSKRHPILFVETRAPDPNLVRPFARWQTLEDFPNLTLLQAQFPSWRWRDGHYVDLERRRLVQEAMQNPLAGK